MDPVLVSTLATIVQFAAPVLIASMGELLTERAGVVNLSLDGTILLSAMAGFAVALNTESVILGILAAMLIGLVVAIIIISTSVFLKLDQIAVGFILTLLCADLSTFLGRPYAGVQGEGVPYTPIPLLEDLPVVGEVLFQHDILIYFSIVLVFLVTFWIYQTRFGLQLRGLGEHPEAAYVRGTRVQLWRFVYVAVGGALVGLAGATFSLSVRNQWAENLTLGSGWIALAIVIFGGWRPWRVAFGAYLLVGLRLLALNLQTEERIDLDLPVQIINMTPWILMLVALVFVSSGLAETLLQATPEAWRPAARRFLRSNPPAALGTNFEKDAG